MEPEKRNVDPESLRGLDDSVKDLLILLLQENKTLNEEMRRVQGRCSELLLKARDWRQRMIGLGGDDPGPP
jgi:hypothetical protein